MLKLELALSWAFVKAMSNELMMVGGVPFCFWTAYSQTQWAHQLHTLLHAKPTFALSNQLSNSNQKNEKINQHSNSQCYENLHSFSLLLFFTDYLNQFLHTSINLYFHEKKLTLQSVTLWTKKNVSATVIQFLLGSKKLVRGLFRLFYS